MKKILLILSILPFFLLSGCGTKTVMNSIMSSWEGCHIDKVIDQWGYPDYEKTVAGHKLFVWEHNKSEFYTGSTNTLYKIKEYCTRTLEVDDNNIVISWEWKGNDCPSFELDEYKKWKNRELTELLQNNEFTNEAINAYNLFNKENLTKKQEEQSPFLFSRIAP